VRISIIGLGLIGGSAGMAWRAAGHHVVGWARRQVTAHRALERGAIDEIATTLEAACAAEVVVLAPPVLAARALMAQVAPHLAPGTVVTDVASTKAQVEAWAREILPAHVRFVGGHPMAGRETAGIEHADGALFRDRSWVIVPPPGADTEAVRAITRLANDTGAETIQLNADAHDRAVAAVSHLPFMAAIALARSVISRPAFERLVAVAGPGLRDMTRLASGDALMHRDICATNRDHILRELERYAEELAALTELIRRLPTDPAENDAVLRETEDEFARLKAARDRWLTPR